MRRSFLLLLLVACSREAAPPGAQSLDGTISFRVLTEDVNASYCRESPASETAQTEDEWIDVFDQQTECQPGQGDVRLPPVDFDSEIGVGLWWKLVPCLGYTVRTTSIDRRGADVIVTAVSTEPKGPCAQAIGQLESFLAVERSDRFTGKERIRMVLDGKELSAKGG